MHEIAIVSLQGFEIRCCVEVFLYACVVGLNCSICHSVDVERIVEAVMSNIMTNSCSDESKQVKFTQL